MKGVKKKEDEGKSARDPDARWGVKQKQKVRDEKGEVKKQVKYFYGYKAHVSLNAETQMITSLTPSSGEAWDGHYFKELVGKDLAQGIPIDTVSADRGYDDHDLHYFLQEEKGLHSGIGLKKIRTQKKDRNKEVWFQLLASPEYQQAQKERYKIERKFGEAKLGHGLARCRYVGLIRFGIQAYLTAIVLNLKRMVKLLTHVGFKAPQYA